MIDNHVHIDFDNLESELEKYIEKAKEIGLAEFTITNHIMVPLHDSHFTIKDDKIFLKDGSFLKCSLISPNAYEYSKIITTKGNSNIHIGAEIHYLEHHEQEIRNFLKIMPFDLVLGSLHVMKGYSVSREKDMKELLTKVSTPNIYRQYFTELKKLVKSGLFDIVSHPDLVRKHTEKIGFHNYAEEAIDLIDVILEEDIGIEVNSAGYRFIGDSYPTIEFLTLCRRKGLEKVTIGSDAHTAEQLGHGLGKVVEKLKKAGYKRIVKFKNRRPEYIDI